MLRQTCSIFKKDFRMYSSLQNETRQLLIAIPGGSVDLTKDNKTGLATVVLNHPEKKNAFSGKMMTDLADIVDELQEWKEGRGVLMHGTNGTFCSGGDLSFMREIMSPAKGGKMCHFMQSVLLKFYQLPLVTLAFVEGNALGGGAELCTACDLRAFAQNAACGFVQSKRGVSPGWGGGVRLVQLLGRTKALRLLASGSILKTQAACDIGLADFAVDNGHAGFTEAQTILLQLTSAAANPHVLHAAKKVVVNATSCHHSDDEALTNERTIFQTVWGHEAHSDGMEGSMKFSS